MNIDQIVVYSQTLYIFYMFTVNKVLIHFKILVVFAFILHIYIYTYTKLLTCIVCLQSSFTGVKWLLWFMKTMCPPSCHCGDNREDTLFSWIHIYYARLASVRFEHSVCRDHLWPLYDHFIYIYVYTSQKSYFLSLLLYWMRYFWPHY